MDPIHSLIEDIDRIRNRLNQYETIDPSLEENQLKRREFEENADRIVQRVQTVSDDWNKDQIQSMEQLLEAVSKLTESGEKMSPKVKLTRLESIRDEMKRKIQNDGKQPARRLQATVNVNLHIDRSVLKAISTSATGKTKIVSTQSSSPPKLNVIVPPPSMKNSSEKRSRTSREELRSDKSGHPSAVTPSSTGSNADNLVSLRTNTYAASMAPDEKTLKIWMKDDNEDKGAVTPQFQRIQSPGGRSPIAKSDKGSARRVRSRSSEKREDSAKDSLASVLESRQSGKANSNMINFVFIFVLIVALCVFGPTVYRILCALMISMSSAAARFELVLEEIVCDVANGLCEQYGFVCSNRCAAGVQQDAWKGRRYS